MPAVVRRLCVGCRLSVPLTISVDAMGGDNAPRMVFAGMNMLLHRRRDVRFLVFGPEGVLRPLLRRFARVRGAAEIRHTEQIVSSGEKPSVALRTGRQSSMRLAIDAVANGEAQGVVSAGNTGALMAMAKLALRTLPGIDRPAIAAVCPTMRGRSVMLDLGANVDCGADNLVQFAIMGEVYARCVLRCERPSVGLLNIGQEEVKGNDAVRHAARILQASALAFRFHGFVEGDDIGRGTVDVVVTDGFTGNIALKTIEGTARVYTQMLKETLAGSLLARIGMMLAKPALRKARQRVDPRFYNGAMFLGLNGVCVKSHGGADAIGFANALRVAIDLVADRVNDGIKEDYARLTAAPAGDLQVVAG